MDLSVTPVKPFNVGFVLVDGFALMSYASAMEPLRAANLISGRTLYEIRHLPIIGARSVSSSGALVGASAYLGEYTNFDLVLVVAGGDLDDIEHPQLYRWLQLLASRRILIGGVSGGPLLLARSGVMHGHRLTVHWEHASRISEISPNLVVERSLYIRDRDRLTCAGGTAALDMMQSLIAEHHGAVLARKVSDWFVHTDIRPGEGPQRVGVAERFGVTDTIVILAVQAMENHLADPLSLSQLASLADVSERQLNRLFKQQLQVSTQAFYRRMRLQKARSLVQNTALPIASIAQSTGFANGAHFCRRFHDAFGVSPKKFRNKSANTTAVHSSP